ncbi:alpha/beta fold hydrolase [Lichenifustis flavocetrariae]|uniref:Alpha/beta hydrolase n=1 Tax=Lichenifustis flavocetrariae TaxID=2949735 RepID=A0AA41Z520_9HYPH|nr:alpha/beta hydrolase [Lichenifustis flavocetrariae]MCW6510420.1 alpha/beta hydrolase [Lichenifustis flavocetrariae]
MQRSKLLAVAAVGFAILASVRPGIAADQPAFGPRLEGFDYAFPVQDFAFESQRQTLHMAYLDVAPKGPANGRTVVLLHGKNFCAGTWDETIRHLIQAGYRVVAPDQIGFCKSSKPPAYQFSFRQLAQNTRDLLVHLGIDRAVMLGHSTGGMLAIRYALMFPDATEQLVLVDPIGLEDWSAKGVPPIGIDQWYARDLKTTADTIRAYEQATYYAGTWQPRFEPWVQMLAGLYRGPGRDAVAWDSALLYDMIMTQPVVYEFAHLRVPTVLMIGDKDITAIGKDLAPPEVRAALGHYPALGQAAAEAIPGAKLVEFATLGHAPQIQDPAAFHAALQDALTGTLPARSVR